MKTKPSQQNIPDGWNETKLSAIGSFSKGAAISKEQLSPSGHNAIRYGELYTKHHFHIRKIYSFVSDEVAEQATKIKYGDIVFAGSGETIDEIGKSAAYLLKEDAYAGGDTIIFSPKKADSLFLSYFLNVGEGRKKLRELGQGQSVVHIYKSDIENLKLHLPPLSEQNRIVAVLETWDQAIQKLSQKIEKKKSIKKGLMQELLTGKTRLHEFKSVWNRHRLGDIATLITKGTTPTTNGFSYQESGVRFIKIESITEDGVLIEDKCAYISENADKSLKRSQLKEGDILFSIAGALGRMYMVNKDCLPANTNQALAIIRLSGSKEVLKDFVYLYLQSKRIKTWIREINVQMAQANIALGDISNLIIEVPELEEQNAIVEILTSAGKEIRWLEHKLKALKQQKRYLLNNLITGTIRTPETLSTHT